MSLLKLTNNKFVTQGKKKKFYFFVLILPGCFLFSFSQMPTITFLWKWRAANALRPMAVIGIRLFVLAVRSVEYTSASADKGTMVPEPLDVAIVSYRIQVKRN